MTHLLVQFNRSTPVEYTADDALDFMGNIEAAIAQLALLPSGDLTISLSHTSDDAEGYG